MNLTDKYLINPFMKEVNHTGFPTSNNEFKMIIGTTGLGKTYTTFNTFIPYLFDEKDLDVILFTYPLTEVFSKTDAMAVIKGSQGVIKAGTNTVAEVRSYSIDHNAEVVEKTAMGDSARSYVSTLTQLVLMQFLIFV